MDMIYAEGEYAGYMNPSYPLNYMEKPLTRLMLGRSFWDLDVKVDTRQFLELHHRVVVMVVQLL